MLNEDTPIPEGAGTPESTQNAPEDKDKLTDTDKAFMGAGLLAVAGIGAGALKFSRHVRERCKMSKERVAENNLFADLDKITDKITAIEMKVQPDEETSSFNLTQDEVARYLQETTRTEELIRAFKQQHPGDKGVSATLPARVTLCRDILLAHQDNFKRANESRNKPKPTLS